MNIWMLFRHKPYSVQWLCSHLCTFVFPRVNNHFRVWEGRIIFLSNSFIYVILFIYNSSLKISRRTVNFFNIIKILSNMWVFLLRDICPRTHCLSTPIWTCRLSLLHSSHVRTSIHCHPRTYSRILCFCSSFSDLTFFSLNLLLYFG